MCIPLAWNNTWKSTSYSFLTLIDNPTKQIKYMFQTRNERIISIYAYIKSILKVDMTWVRAQVNAPITILHLSTPKNTTTNESL